MKRWTEAEKDYLKCNYISKTDQEIADSLGRTIDSVRKARQRLKLNKTEINALDFVDSPEKYSGVCGIFGLVSPSGKALVLSSHNVWTSYKQNLSKIKNGTYSNLQLSKDYNSDFVFAFFERCPEEELFHRRDFYARSIDSYNQNFVAEYPKITKKDIERLKEKTVWVGDCLEYVGGLSKNKYGKINILGKDYSTHRLMYFYEYGTYPTLLRHTCHNTKCCNPKHLISGSARQNSLDSVEEDRIEFERVFLKHKGVTSSIAKELSLTPDTVSHKIKDLDLRAKHNIPYIPPKIYKAPILKDEAINSIPKYFGLYEDKDIAEICNCSKTLVAKVRRKHKVKPFSINIGPHGPFLSRDIDYFVCDGVFGSCYDIMAEKFGESYRHKYYQDEAVRFLEKDFVVRAA